MTKVEIITIIIYLVVYAVVFVIQKAQYEKQKSIMEKYEKMFSIINIDEIEKYVNMKEKSLKLEFENREKGITALEEQISLLLEKSSKTFEEIGDFKNQKEENELMMSETIEIIAKKKKIANLLIELNQEEFNQIYNTTFERLKLIGDEKFQLNLAKELLEIRKKYITKKEDLMK
jgi:hypothetical protein